MASGVTSGVNPGSSRAGGRSHTSGTHSASFNSVAVNQFMDESQEKFVSMLMVMGGYINLIASVLQLNIVLGPGHSMASTITADPLMQPMGHPPFEPNSSAAFSLIGGHVSHFLTDLRCRFQSLVNSLCIRSAVLVIDMRLGDGHHVNSTVRPSPESDGLPSPSPHSPGGGFGPENDPDDRHDGGRDVASPGQLPVALRRLGSLVDTASTMPPQPHDDVAKHVANEESGSEVLPEFSTPTPGAVAAFFARFNGASARPDDVPTENYGIELMDTSESEQPDIDGSASDIELGSAYDSDTETELCDTCDR